MDEADVRGHLHAVEDPDFGDDVVSLGLVSAVGVDNGTVRISLAFGAPYSLVETDIDRQIREVLAEDGLEVGLTAKMLTDRDPDEEALPGVESIIAVASGENGVGKSTVTVNLAADLSKLGTRVGLFGADIYGPNIPQIIAAEEAPQATQGQTTVPPGEYGVKLVSMAFLVDGDDPVIWRDPMVHQLLTQLVENVEWNSLDYLVPDLPPNIGDTQLSTLQTLPLTGAVIVTTPQNVALDDANKGLRMLDKHNMNVLGIVENMSTFRCPDCGNRHNIFGAGSGREFAVSNDLPFLGALPLGPAVCEGGDGGKPIVLKNGDETADTFRVMTEDATDMVGIVQRRSVSER